MPISDLVTSVAHVRCFRNNQLLGAATGFFYSHEERMHFITNRHVVIQEDEDYYPDELRLELHTNMRDVSQNTEYSVRLYDGSGNPCWIEHPRGGGNIDVVALPLDTQQLSSGYVIRSFSSADHIPEDVDIAIGEDVLVIGYPLGFHDMLHNLPIVRNAIMASVYPVPFQGNPFILIDARLHSGTSGSPVITKATNMIRRTNGSTAIMNRPVSFLVGVHSASFDLNNRDPQRDEPLGLNAVWFASLIPEIIMQGG